MLFHNIMACCFAFLQDFEQDAFDCQRKVEDIDRRLGTVFIQAFDDASDLEHTFKVCYDKTGSSGGSGLEAHPQSVKLQSWREGVCRQLWKYFCSSH